MGQSIAYGTPINSCSYNTLTMSQNFHLILQLGGTYAIMGKKSYDIVFLWHYPPYCLKSVNFTETQKSRDLKNETMFLLQVKNSLITDQGLLYCKKQFCRGGDL